MPPRKTPIAIVALLAIALGAAVALAATDAEAQDVANYPTVVRKPVTIWSDGTRLAGDVFLPKGLAADQKIPAIVLCHGWGGMKSHLNQRIAPQFSAAGYAVLTFDYRGWGESDGRLVVRGDMPKPDDNGNVTVKAQLVREVVDPFDQEDDIDAAISFFAGEPHVDASRIGIWGSSLGGSHVIWRAGNDARVKAVVSQVGGYFRSEQMLDPAAQAANDKIKTQRARGEIDPVPQGGLEQFKELKGSPVPRAPQLVPARRLHRRHRRAGADHPGREGALLQGRRPRRLGLREAQGAQRPGRVPPDEGHRPLRHLSPAGARRGDEARDRVLRQVSEGRCSAVRERAI